MNVYRALKDKDINRLAAIVGADLWLSQEADLAHYARNETEDLPSRPEVVFLPRTPEQIAAVLRWAHAEKIAVTPRAAGTNLCGSAVPVHGGILLSLERMNQILEIDASNAMAVVQPGVITQVFQEAVEAQGLFYPPDPASRGSCHLGGNLAHGAAGPRAVKYGGTRDYVRGVQAVLPTGEIIRHGGKTSKNATGYNLTQLLIGSEGTLAVVTEITLRLLPLPRFRLLVAASFPQMAQAAETVPRIFQAGIVPSAVEFMEADAVALSSSFIGKQIFSGNLPADGACLLIELDGFDLDHLVRERETLGEVLLAGYAQEILVADSQDRQQEMWKLRRSIAEAVRQRGPYQEEDTVVPRSRIAALIAQVKRICSATGTRSVCYGHAGDGNIHVNLLRENLDEQTWRECLPGTIRGIFEQTVALGGLISGEHGIGLSQRAYLPLVFNADEMALMMRLKEAFDPAGILNPGKIFPLPLPGETGRKQTP